MFDWFSFVCLVLAVRQLTDLYFTMECFDTVLRDAERGFKPFNCDYCMNLWGALCLTGGWAYLNQFPPIVFLTLWWSVAYTAWVLDVWLPLSRRWSRPQLISTPYSTEDTSDNTDAVADIAGDGLERRADSASDADLFRTAAVAVAGDHGGCGAGTSPVTPAASGPAADHLGTPGTGSGGAGVYGVGTGQTGVTGSGC